MRRWLILLPLALILVLASTALAQKTIIPTLIDDPTDIKQYGINVTDPTMCLFGNLNDPAWGLGGWLTGEEAYKYLFYPWDTCDCQLGFWLQKVHIFLNFPEDMQFPHEFQVYVDLEDALWDPAMGCWVPGIEDCVSPLYIVTIPEPGLYDLGFSIGNFCECAFMDYYYFLSVHFPVPVQGELVSDDSATPCTVFNNWGSGWVDLFTQGFSDFGNLLIYGEGVCCDQPVDVQPQTWGQVKSLYR